MNIEPSAADGGHVSPDSVREVVRRLIHKAVHIDKRSYADLERDSGVKARAIKAYHIEGREPSGSSLLSLALAFGDGGVNAVLALIGYAGRPRDEADADAPMLRVAGMMRHLAVIGECAADGRIDHVEAPKCDEAASAIIAEAANFQRGRAA